MHHFASSPTRVDYARSLAPANCFYKLLILGKQVEPGLGNAHYMALLNAERKRKGKAPEPIEDVPRPPVLPPLGADEDRDVPLKPADPPPRKKPRVGGASSSGGVGKAKAAPAKHPPPLPPVHVPPLPPFVEPPPAVVDPPEPGSGDEDVDVLVPGPRDPDQPPRHVRPDAKEKWRRGVGGVRIRYDEYLEKRTGRLNKNWLIMCNVHGGSCKKNQRGHTSIHS